MSESWIRDNIESIMLVFEIFMFSCVAAVFVVYFIVKRKLKMKKAQEQANQP